MLGFSYYAVCRAPGGPISISTRHFRFLVQEGLVSEAFGRKLTLMWCPQECHRMLMDP